MLEALPQGMVHLDGAGRVVEANGSALRLLRRDRDSLLSQSLFPSDCRLLAAGGTALAPEHYPGAQLGAGRVPKERAMVGLGWADGIQVWLDYSATPLAQGGVLMTFEDRTEAYYAQAILAARSRIVDLGATATLEQILRATLDEAELLTGSCIGFYHFMDADQENLTLQAWSTRTGRDFCKAEGHGLHYPVKQAGVWVDAVRQGVPVIHNDYASLPHRKGLPEGHAHVLRELVVPVLRGGRIVAVLGVGNKQDPYGSRDVETVQQFADLAWEVAEKKRTEEALFASQTQHLSMLRTAMDAVWLLDGQGRILEVNDAACLMLGYSREELLGRTPSDLEAAESQAETRAHFELIVQRGWDIFESVHRRRDGTTLPVEVSATHLPDTGQFVVYIRDMSDRKRLEVERLELEQQFQRAQKMESLGSLAGGVAHDMNNVLGAIMALSSIHEAQAPRGSSQQRSMETITKACLRGRTLVQGLLGFARQGITEERLLNLNEVVREQTALLEHTTLQRVRLEMELDRALAPVLGDPAALGHALMNLCVNAVDAMPEGGTLTLRTRNAGPTLVELEIQDSGKGMPPEVMAKAMDPFFTTKPQGKGTGLGLSIVYGTVKSHRGHLDLHSTEGVGTRITIQLPAAARESGPAPLVLPPSPNAQPLRVLVVDDDELLQMSLCILLQTLGHTSEAVESGEAALALLETGAPFDLVVLDLNMPGLGGAGTLPLLRQLRRDLPVVVATGRANQQAAELVAQHSKASILPKPFTLEELKAHLALVLPRRGA